MATINDFKLLKKKCLAHFNLACKNEIFEKSYIEKLSDIEKERFGFYYFIIQQTTGLNEYDEITDIICDCDFNSKLFGVRDPDEGIDAIYVNENDGINEIILYNFKYRDSFNPDSKQRENEVLISSKLISAIITNNTDTLRGKVKKAAEIIISKLNSQDIWNVNLYYVSNECTVLNPTDHTLKNFAETYNIKVSTIGLDKINDYMSIRPEGINAKLIIPSENILSFSENNLSSNKSYIVTIPLTELVRITCNDNYIRDEYNIEDDSKLSDVDMDYNVLFDNVRGFIVGSKFNQNIEKTLNDDPSRFFFYNNGITIVADNIRSTPANAGKKQKIEITNFQVLNGGQTLRTIHNFNKKDNKNITAKLSKAYSLVKILEVTENSIKNKIGEYTNSQNAIDLINLKSIREEQILIEQYLKENNILYVRKKGDVGSDSFTYEKTIGIERFGQILLSKNGKPEEISNKKRQIFNEYYDELFTNNDSLISEETIKLVNKYFEISQIYKKSYSKSEQKIMYIIFLSEFISEDYSNLICEFEQFMDQYYINNKIETSLSRMLILASFKNALKSHFESKYNNVDQ